MAQILASSALQNAMFVMISQELALNALVHIQIIIRPLIHVLVLLPNTWTQPQIVLAALLTVLLVRIVLDTVLVVKQLSL